MKKQILLFLSTILLIAMTSCNWQVPQKVIVKTEASYELSLGGSLLSALNTEELLGNFDVKSLIKENMSFPNGKIYDYNPNLKSDNVQQFLVRIPIQEIPVDFSSYMENSDFSQAMNEMNLDEKEISVPELSSASTKTSISDLSALHLGLAALLTAQGNATGGNQTLAYAARDVGTFNSIKVSHATYVIRAAVPDGSRVTLETRNGVTSYASAVFTDGEARVSLSNFEFTPATLINMDVPGSYIAAIDPDSTVSIKNASGVTLTQPIDLEIQPVSFALLSNEAAGDFVEAQVDEGVVNVALDYNSSWTGITSKFNVELSGSLTVPDTEITDSLDLSNKVVSGTDDTTLEAEAHLFLNNANIDFSNDYAIDIIADCSVSAFKYITVNFADAASLGQSSSEALPEEVLKTIKEIYILSSGINGTYVNTLPEGDENNIELSIESNFLGLRDSVTITPSKESKEYSLMSKIDSALKRELGTGEGKYNSIDYSVSIKLPGSSEEHPERITLHNVKPNDTYKINLTVNPVINYEKIVIDTSDYSQSDTMELGINISSMLSELNFQGVNLGDKFELSTLPVYLMAVKPNLSDDNGSDLFAGAKFTGNISLFMGKNNVPVNNDEGEPAVLDLLGDSTNNKSDVLMFTGMPSITTSEDDAELVISDLEKDLKDSVENHKVLHTDFADLLNMRVDDDEATLCIKYDMSFSNGDGDGKTLTITKEQVDGADATSIAVVAYLVLPLEFKLTEDLNLPLVESENNSSEQTSDSSQLPDSVQALLDVVRDASITITPKALPFVITPEDSDVAYGLELAMNLTSDYHPVIGIANNKSSVIRVKNSEIKSLIRTMAGGNLSPGISLKLAKGSISIPRTMDFDANIILGLNTDGPIEIYPNLLGVGGAK